MRKTVCFLILSCMCMSASADVEWLQSSYDFGLMKEIAGPKEGKVRFVNHGPEEVVILDMRPSCGCTSVSYPDTPIAPGDTASVSFTYDPTGRPGRFEKTVKVIYTGEPGVKIIPIAGNVLGTSESLAKIYPDESGPLRFTSTLVYGGEIKHGKARDDFFTVYNQSSDSITPAVVKRDPLLGIESTDLRLGPGDTATFSVFYNSREDDRYGPVAIPFEIKTDSGDPSSPVAKLSYHVNVIPDFSDQSEEDLKNAPRIEIEPDRINAGTIEEGKGTHMVSLKISNPGKRPLRLLRIYSVYPEVEIKDYPRTVKPGKTVEIKIGLLPDKISQGIFRTQMKILTDDPSQPVTDVNIFGTNNGAS